MSRQTQSHTGVIAGGLLAVMVATVVIFVAIHLVMALAAAVTVVAIYLDPREPWAFWSGLLASMVGAAVAIFAGIQSARRPKAGVQSFRRTRVRTRPRTPNGQ